VAAVLLFPILFHSQISNLPVLLQNPVPVLYKSARNNYWPRHLNIPDVLAAQLLLIFISITVRTCMLFSDFSDALDSLKRKNDTLKYFAERTAWGGIISHPVINRAFLLVSIDDILSLYVFSTF
jgi:hypothetical protein